MFKFYLYIARFIVDNKDMGQVIEQWWIKECGVAWYVWLEHAWGTGLKTQ